ncbi:hypothetical protein Ciccas_002192 [Cichlidogyrus casuarinus]|uniref:peptide-methionine (R)-S-oxide reductase n=1 Tax=Cichlidogyrus casuarinus TaxID=1844966 RepID=A0ABD2QHZ7_9PLAT
MIVVHITPGDVQNELDELYDDIPQVVAHYCKDLAAGACPIVILGDMNADCGYLSKKKRKGLKFWTDKDWFWLVQDGVDTTIAKSRCTYDRSDTKFSCPHGWPAFSAAVHGSVKESPDNTLGMQRVEVTCNNCGSHLGHVFEGEGYNAANRRFCINSASLSFNEEEKI